MKKYSFLSLICLFLLGLVSACSDNDSDNNDGSIVFPNEGQTNQTVYADDESGASEVKLVTTHAWTSAIQESVTLKTSLDTQPKSDWVSITPNSGNAGGEYTLQIKLEPNYSGADRSAIIMIKSNGVEMPITINQKATKEDGSEIENPDEKDNLGFLAIIDNKVLVLLNETTDILRKIDTIQVAPRHYLELSNYNDETKKAYYYIYNDSADTPSSNVFAINIDTKVVDSIAMGIQAYDYLKVTKNGDYIYYDRAKGNKKEIVKYNVTAKSEKILYETNLNDEIDININNTNSIVMVTKNNEIIVFDNDAEKYKFTLETNYISASLSPLGNKLLVTDYKTDGSIMICDLDGSNPAYISHEKPNIPIESAIWSINQKYIYYDIDNSGSSIIYKLKVADSKAEILKTLSSSDEDLYSSDVLSIKLK